MLKRGKLTLLVVVILTLGLVLSGCGSDTDSTADGVKEDLVVAQGADPKSLDPHSSNDQPSSRVNRQIYETLVDTDVNMNIVSGLAESWEQIDDLTWEFTLRQGVKFHNGEELKASDVKFSIERAIASPEVSHIVESIASVEAPEDYKIIVKTKEPYAPLLYHLAHNASQIVSQKAVEESGEDYGQHPVGTGPFKFKEWQSGDKVVLERFDDYYKETASVKTITFRNIPEGTNRTIGLETGEIDIAYDIEPIDEDRVTTHDKLKLIEGPYLSVNYIGFNTRKAPFDKKEVRQAINYIINKQDLIDVVLDGKGTIANSPIAPEVFGYTDETEAYLYDVEKAKKLLKEAGYEDGFKTTIWTNDSSERVQIANIVQAQLAEIGIDASIEILEWGSYLERTATGEHDMYILGWVAVTADADNGLYSVYHSANHGAPGNRMFYTNKEVDRLLDEGRSTLDPEARKAAYKEAQMLIMEDSPVVQLYYETQNAGMQKNVEGFELHPAGAHNLYGVDFQ